MRVMRVCSLFGIGTRDLCKKPKYFAYPVFYYSNYLINHVSNLSLLFYYINIISTGLKLTKLTKQRSVHCKWYQFRSPCISPGPLQSSRSVLSVYYLLIASANV